MPVSTAWRKRFSHRGTDLSCDGLRPPQPNPERKADIERNKRSARETHSAKEARRHERTGTLKQTSAHTSTHARTHASASGVSWTASLRGATLISFRPLCAERARAVPDCSGWPGISVPRRHSRWPAAGHGPPGSTQPGWGSKVAGERPPGQRRSKQNSPLRLNELWLCEKAALEAPRKLLELVDESGAGLGRRNLPRPLCAEPDR